MPSGTPNEAWLDLDLADTLAALAEAGHGPAVIALLEAPRRDCPELLLCALAAARGEYGPLQREVLLGSQVDALLQNPVGGCALQLLTASRHRCQYF